MGKFLIGLGAALLGFGFYNLIFEDGNIYLTNDWFIPYLNIRYSTLTTDTASQIIIGIGFAAIIVGVILFKRKNRN